MSFDRMFSRRPLVGCSFNVFRHSRTKLYVSKVQGNTIRTPCTCLNERSSFSRKKRIIQKATPINDVHTTHTLKVKVRQPVQPNQEPSFASYIEDEFPQDITPIVEFVENWGKTPSEDRLFWGASLLAELEKRIQPLDSFDARHATAEQLFARLQRVEEWGMKRDEAREHLMLALETAAERRVIDDAETIEASRERIADLENQLSSLRSMRDKHASESASEAAALRDQLREESKRHEGLSTAMRAQLRQAQQAQEALRAEVSTSSASLRAVKLDVDAAQEALCISQQIIEDQDKMLLEAREGEVELHQVVLSLQRNRLGLEGLLKEKEVARETLQRELTLELNDLRTAMQVQVEQHEEGMETWAEEKGEIEAQVDMLNGTVESLKHQLGTAAEKKEESDRQQQESLERIEALKQEVEQLEEQLCAKEVSIEELRLRQSEYKEELRNTHAEKQLQEEAHQADMQVWEDNLAAVSKQRNAANAKVNVLKSQLKEETTHTEEIRRNAMLQVEAAMGNVESSRHRVEILTQRMQGEIQKAAQSQVRCAKERARIDKESESLSEAATSEVERAAADKVEVMSSSSHDVSSAVKLMDKHVAALRLLTDDTPEGGVRIVRDPVGILRAALEDGGNAFQEMLVVQQKLAMRAEEAAIQQKERRAERGVEQIIEELKAIKETARENEELEKEVHQLKVTLRSLEALLGDDVSSLST